MKLRGVIKKRVKKSQGFLEMLVVVVFLLGVGLFILVLNTSYDRIKTPLNTGLNNALPEDSPFNATAVLDKTSSATQSFDRLLPFLIIGLFAFIMISAGAYLQHPIMIFIGIIMFGVVILIAVIYSNVYQNIAETTSFSSANSDLPIQNKFMQYLPIVAGIMIAGTILALIWSRRGYSGGGL
jgi:hypothetical protein